MKTILCVGLLCIVSLPLLAERKLVSHADMEYPVIALTAGVEDSIGVTIVVNPDGSVKSAKSSSQKRLLADAAEKNVNTWKFDAGGEEIVYAVFTFKIVDKGKEKNDFDTKNFMVTVAKVRPPANPATTQ